ncbi:hypothetical protein B5F85_06505 [Olsenella sp. An293]|nr:hypothetical protein B5F85_06505 [Olsenella sp. An293]
MRNNALWEAEKNGALVTGKTHVIVGAAAGLAAASALGPGLASPAALACAAAGGALGGMLPDLDVRNTAHPLQERLARVGCAVLLVFALGAEAAAGWPLARRAAEAGLDAVAAGAIALVALGCAARLSAHRGFSHSLAALAGFAAATWLVCPPLAAPVATGMASHLALDALTHRGLRLLWPARRGLSLSLCRTDGVVEACCLVAGLAVAAYVVLLAL